MIRFSDGNPSLLFFPSYLLKKANENILYDKEYIKLFCNYPNPQGVLECRKAICKFVSNEFNEIINENQIMLQSGVGSALDATFTLFSKPGDEIIIEDPSYYEMKCFINEYKLNVISIESDNNGFNIDILENKLQNNEITPKFMYIVSDYSNPKGISLSHDKRKKLVNLANEYKFLLISDEVYQFLYFSEDNKPLKPLASYETSNKSGYVISITSLAKTMMPSFRLGWIYSKNNTLLNKYISRAVEQTSGLHSSYSAGLFTKILELGLFKDRLIFLRNQYYLLAKTMMDELDIMINGLSNEHPELKDQIIYRKPTGGFFIWLQFPNWMKTNTFLPIAESSFNINYKPGCNCSFANTMNNNCMRLCFGFYNKDDIKQGIKQLHLFINYVYKNKISQ